MQCGGVARLVRAVRLPTLSTAVVAVLAAGEGAIAQPFAYVVGQSDDPAPGNSGTQVVTVVDTANNQKVARIPVGLGCLCVTPESMAISPDGTRVYVTNEQGSSVSVIATSTNTVIDTIAVGDTPAAVDVSPDGSRFFVLSGFPAYVVSTFSTATHALLSTIPVSALQARGIAVTPNGRRLYVTTYGANTVKVVDLDSSSVIATIPVGNLPLGIDITPDGSLVYVRNLSPGASGNTVSVIRTADHRVIATIPATTYGHSVGAHPGGEYVYSTGTPISVISTQTQTTVATIPGSAASRDMAFTPDGTRAYFADAGRLVVVNTTTNTVVSSVTFDANTEGQLAAVAIAPPPRLEPPTGLQLVGILGNVVTLQWTRPPFGVTPDSYFVTGGISPGEVLATLPTGSARPVFSFSAPPGVYYVRVHSAAGPARSHASNEIRIVVNPLVPPSPPTGLVGLVNGSQVALAWRNATTGGAPTSLLLEVTGTITTTIPLAVVDTYAYAAVPDGTYTLSISAVNGFGASTSSNPVTLTFPGACSGPPLPPDNVAASTFGTEITVIWSPAGGGSAPTGYQVQVTGTIIASVATTARSASGNVGPGTYLLSVAATNPCGSSPFAAVQTITVP